MTIADLEQFIIKNKSITYIGAFDKLYNWKNCRQIYEIYRMVELEKEYVSTFKNSYNLGVYWIVKISSISHNAYVVSRD